MKKNFEQLSLFNYKSKKIKTPQPQAPTSAQNLDIPQNLDATLSQNSQTLQSLTTATEELQKRIKNVEQNAGGNVDLSSIESSISTLNNSVSANSSDISTLQSSISTLNSSVSTNATNISTLQNSVSTNSSNISTLQSTVATNSSNISTLNSSVSAHSTSISSLQSSLNSQSTALSTIQTTVGGFSDSINSNSNQITALSSRLTDCESAINQMDSSASLPTTDLFTVPNSDFKSPIYSIYDDMCNQGAYQMNNANLPTPKFYFMVRPFTTFTLDIDITMNVKGYSQPQYLELYIDDVLVEKLEYLAPNQYQTVTYHLSHTHYSTTGYHYYHFFFRSPYSSSVHQNHLSSSSKIYGINCLFLSRKSLVRYFPASNGTYYFSRTLDGYGQYFAVNSTDTFPSSPTWTYMDNYENYLGGGHTLLPYYTKDQNDVVTHQTDFFTYLKDTRMHWVYDLSNISGATANSYVAELHSAHILSPNGNLAVVCDVNKYSYNIGSSLVCYQNIQQTINTPDKYYNTTTFPNVTPPLFPADCSTVRELVPFNTINRPIISVHVSQVGRITIAARFSTPTSKSTYSYVDFGTQPNAYFINDNCDIAIVYSQFNIIKKSILTLDQTTLIYSVTSTQILGAAQAMVMGYNGDLFAINNQDIKKVQ